MALRFFIVLVFSLFISVANASSKWEYQTEGMITGQPLVFEDNIYVLSGTELTVLNREGKLQWKYALGAKTYSQVTIDKNQQSLYLLGENGLHAIDFQGKNKWFFPSVDKPVLMPGKHRGWGNGQFVDNWAWYRSSPTISGDKVIFSNFNGTYALSKKSGEQVWFTNTGVTHTKPAVENGMVVVGSWNNKLYGLNDSNGNIQWQIEGRTPKSRWGGWKGFPLSPVIEQGVAYVGSRGTYFYAVDIHTGQEKWSHRYKKTWIGSPAIIDDGSVYFGTSDGYSLVAHNLKTGQQISEYKNDFYNFAQPQVNSKSIFYASLSGQVYQINKNSKSMHKIFSTTASIANYNDLVRKEGGYKPYYGIGDAYNHQSGAKDVERMLFKLNSILSLTLSKDSLYLGTASGKLIALDI